MKRLKILACLLAGGITFGSIIFPAATDWYAIGQSEAFTYTMIEDFNSKTNVAQAVNTGDILMGSYELANSGVGASQALKLITTDSISYAYLNIFEIPGDNPYLVMYINSSAAADMQLYPNMAGNSSYFFSSGDVYCYTAGGTAEKLTISNNAIKLKQGGYYYRFDMTNAPDGMSFTSMWGVRAAFFTSSATTVVIDDIYTTDSTSTNVPGNAGTGEHPSSWAKEEVSSAITEGLIPQDLQQNYTQTITKAQMAALLEKALATMGAPADVYTQVFSMVSGEGNMSRLDIALLIARLQELLGIESYLESFTFIDAHLISAENKPKIDFAYEYSAMVPKNNRSFSPDADYTIEEAIVSIYRIKNLYGNVKSNYIFKVSGAYGDGMILQRDTQSQIVGTAPAGTTITIQLFDSQLNNVYEKSSVTPVSGKWSVPIMGRIGSFEKYKLIVSDGQTTTTFNDVMFGEVWVAGGQSNMELPISSSAEVIEWQNEEYGLNISIFHQSTWQPNYIYTPLTSPTGQWKQASSYDNIKDCSAVAVSFAYKLYRSLNSGSENIPVGIIYNAVGATTITTWISRYEIENTPELFEAANNRGIYVAKGDWNNPSAYDTMSALYNTRVAPFKGYTQLSDAMRKATYDMEIVVFDSRTNGTITIDNIRFSNMLPEITKYSVTYVADGQSVYTVEVEYGQDATAPAVPAKDGYTGVWDKDGKNIVADTIITAVYTKIPASEDVDEGDDDNSESPGGNESSSKDDDNSDDTVSNVSDIIGGQDNDDNVGTGVTFPFITALVGLVAAAMTLLTLRRRSSF